VSGAVWFTESNANKIGRVTTVGQTFTEYPVPTAGSYSFLITSGPDGALWFTEQNANKIGRLTHGRGF
jgi:virginiamycin B lyase